MSYFFKKLCCNRAGTVEEGRISDIFFELNRSLVTICFFSFVATFFAWPLLSCATHYQLMQKKKLNKPGNERQQKRTCVKKIALNYWICFMWAVPCWTCKSFIVWGVSWFPQPIKPLNQRNIFSFCCRIGRN